VAALCCPDRAWMERRAAGLASGGTLPKSVVLEAATETLPRSGIVTSAFPRPPSRPVTETGDLGVHLVDDRSGIERGA
jgi:hypothetical protein